MKASTIIIGAGGVGSQICAKVEEELRCAKRQGGAGNAAENTRFIAIDTDVNSLRDLQRHGFSGKRILLTDNMTVAKCRDTINDPSINKWYPENTIFGKKSMTEGAGQQRSISRLAFEYCVRDGRLDVLDNTIRDLNEITRETSFQQSRFYIISSLAGGTGSGIILPLAMYINDTVKRMYGDSLSICKGFFILSSAFYAKSRMPRLEKKSLDANAYAAVKELSAFMRAADTGSFDSDRGPLTYPLPESGPYHGPVYEYCYLFGLTNAKNLGIHSFEELKNLVADSVYMQACSPMQEQNNSREDNTLRHTAMLGQTHQENWLRRFGGIGCGRLIYPYEDLVRYLGLVWAKDTMGSTWRQYDEAYFEARKNAASQLFGRAKNAGPDQGAEYIKMVDGADAYDHLAAYIREECDGRNDVPPWKGYLDALGREAELVVDRLWMEYEQRSDWALFHKDRQNLALKGKDAKSSEDRYQSGERASTAWAKICKDMEQRLDADCISTGDRLFRLHPWTPGDADSLRECWLEYWLVSNDGEFMHPNSVRYFLYQLKDAIALDKKSPNPLDQTDPPFRTNKKEALTLEEGKQTARRFQEQQGRLQEFMKGALRERLLVRCESYVKKLIDCYEEFYSGYDMILDEFDADIRTIGKKLDRHQGISHYYVCADETCRESLHAELRLRRSYEVGAVSGVSQELFRLIHESGMVSGKMSSRECANRIKDYWCAGIEQESFSKDLLDLNILRAMNKESQIKRGRSMSEEDFEGELMQVQDSLAEPFLQFFRRLDMNTGISLCCYHSSLLSEMGTYRNVVDWLKDHNAVDDPTYCTKRELMFYRSFVGLEPYEVLDYLHGISAKTAMDGPAFRSYREMLRDMGKSGTCASKVMTPHADTAWHSLHHMEDPSAFYQNMQELLITTALLSAWLNGGIRKNQGEKAYRFTLCASSEPAEVTFDQLVELHYIFYGNYHWYIRQCWYTYELIQNALDHHVDPYEILSSSNKRSPFDLLVLYQMELPYGRRSTRQKELLADAAVCLLYACTEKPENQSREKACIDRAKEYMQKTLDIVNSRSIQQWPEGEEKTIDDTLKGELANFIGDFKDKLSKMKTEAFLEKYEHVLEASFVEFPHED